MGRWPRCPDRYIRQRHRFPHGIYCCTLEGLRNMKQVRRDRGLLMISARFTFDGGHFSAGAQQDRADAADPGALAARALRPDVEVPLAGAWNLASRRGLLMISARFTYDVEVPLAGAWTSSLGELTPHPPPPPPPPPLPTAGALPHGGRYHNCLLILDCCEDAVKHARVQFNWFLQQLLESSSVKVLVTTKEPLSGAPRSRFTSVSRRLSLTTAGTFSCRAAAQGGLGLEDGQHQDHRHAAQGRRPAAARAVHPRHPA